MEERLAIHHLAVVVRDLGRAEAFYVDALGLPLLKRWEDEAGAPRSIWVELGGGAFLAIERAALEGPRREDAAPGFHCMALGIQPELREVWRERLKVAGFPVERESPFTLYVRDPEGNLVGLSHHPHRAGAPRDG
ncbi:VOC family protein [Chondromyces crocatus]|uniref:Glyoxalase n=1 Tax=Chondromyces crocatus TaxID=52 RepID=A0A0K1EMQ6_CHOCO|nr:VOC family protein [Chondromyces crocatus]AKT42096.1 glyoxalase [Chondromyces crocatus]